MKESGKGGGVRSIAAYQGEAMRPDRGLLREARSGFEAALKQLDRISCCGGEEEEHWPLINETIGNDDDSIRVMRFLDGRRKVDSPASSPSPFTYTFGDTWPLRGGGDDSNIDCWADCGTCGKDRQRKDSAFEVHQNTEPKSEHNKHPVTRKGEQRRYLEDLYLDAPRTPMVVTFGPTSDVDWLRFSYLLRNNNLSFDDIAELVSRYTPDGDALPQNDVAQQGLTNVDQPDVRNKRLRISVRRSGVVEWDVATLGEDGHAPTLSVGNSRNMTSETSCGAEDLDPSGMHGCHHAPSHPYNLPRTVRIGESTEQTPRWEDAGDQDESHDRRSSEEQDISRSCFSCDSSVDSLDFSKPEIGILATKMKPTVLSWLRPKRKYDSLHGGTKLANCPGPKEASAGLWKRISKITPNYAMDANLKEKADRKLQAKLSNTKLRASGANQIPINDCHSTYREQTNAANIHPDLSTSSHILNAMRALNSPCASQSVPGNTTTSQRGSYDSSLLKSRPSSSIHANNIAQYGFYRPYKPSPLKHVTRVTSLDVNKGLPPLPPEARRVARQASQARLKELQAVKKVDIRKAINEYVGEMARAY